MSCFRVGKIPFPEHPPLLSPLSSTVTLVQQVGVDFVQSGYKGHWDELKDI